MTADLMQAWLDSQAMSLGKGPKESAAAQVVPDVKQANGAQEAQTVAQPVPAADPVQPKDYVDQDYCPVDLVCPSCGRKHWDTFPNCLSCSQME